MKKLVLFLIISGCCISAIAQQQPPFWNDIQQFRKQDSVSFPAANKILFVGSSSFTLWKDVQDYFPKHPIINRGFGGSSLTDLIRYSGDIIFPYNPKQIVIYCGENDFAGDEKLTADSVVRRFVTLFKLIRSFYPVIPIAYVSMKPSPSRTHLMPRFAEANKGIKIFLKHYNKTKYVDVYHAMLTRQGRPISNIFLKDSLHMNEKGYKIWQKKLESVLRK